MTTRILAFLFAIIAFPAFADEQVLAESTVGQGGLICDTPQEVEQFLQLVESGTSAQDAINFIDGCGILVKPMLMRVVLVKTGTKYNIVRYDFLGSSAPPQFGAAPVKGQDA